MMKNKNNLLIYIQLLLVIVVLISIAFNYYEIKEIKNQTNNLNEIYIGMSNTNGDEQNIDEYENYIKEYILNQNKIEDLWWNTIINQGGLSIIFTAIILFITISISWITQNNINQKYKEELDLLKKYTDDLTSDVLKINKVHTGTFGAGLYSQETYLSNAYNRVNIFNDLKVLTKNKLNEIYNEDLINLSHRIVENIYRKQVENNLRDIINNHINRITNDNDKIFIKQYLIKHINNKKYNYPPDKYEEFITKDEHIIEIIADIILKFEIKANIEKSAI